MIPMRMLTTRMLKMSLMKKATRVVMKKNLSRSLNLEKEELV